MEGVSEGKEGSQGEKKDSEREHSHQLMALTRMKIMIVCDCAKPDPLPVKIGENLN